MREIAKMGRKAVDSNQLFIDDLRIPVEDRPLILGVANDALWRAFCRIAKIEQLATDPRFATNAARVQRREETVKLVSEILRSRTREEWIRDLGQAGIPCSPVHTLGELSAHPHTTAVGMVYEYPGTGPAPLKGVAQPVKFDGARTTAQRLPPKLGEHTREILKEAGYSDAEILGFEEIGVVRS